MEDNSKKTTQKRVVGKPFPKGVSGNPNGRPRGSLDFKTKFNIFLDKVAKQRNTTRDEVEQELFDVALHNAKKGDYKFYKDIFDRVYGKAEEKVGLNIENVSEEEVQARASQIFNNDNKPNKT